MKTLSQFLLSIILLINTNFIICGSIDIGVQIKKNDHDDNFRYLVSLISSLQDLIDIIPFDSKQNFKIFNSDKNFSPEDFNKTLFSLGINNESVLIVEIEQKRESDSGKAAK